MRLWSPHPKYLDRLGINAVWCEGLLAQSVLLKGEYIPCDGENHKRFSSITTCPKCKGTGKIKTPWYNHPQLERFKFTETDRNRLTLNKQLFKQLKNGWKEISLRFMSLYLKEIFNESQKRNYNFRIDKIYNSKLVVKHPRLTVTTGQLEYEFDMLQRRLQAPLIDKKTGKAIAEHRDLDKFLSNCLEIESRGGTAKEKIGDLIEPHPLFSVVSGGVEKWEKIK